LALCLTAPLGRPARAGQKFGPLELSGNVESQNLIRNASIDKLQFIQNRNTVRLRVDYDWLQKGRLIDRFDLPFIERSKLYILYRGVYDGYYDIAPTDLVHGQTRFDDLVGGPIAGNNPGQLDANKHLLPGSYSRYTANTRSGIKFENTLREAYIDLKLAQAPVSFRLGRQQVIWGESDQFRLMDVWNPIDVTWHLQQESWDNIRVGHPDCNSVAFTLVAKRMKEPKASMMICTTVVMGTTLPFTRGSRLGFMAMRMMLSTPAKKSPTESFAVKGISMSSVVTLASRALAKSGSFIRSRNSGSWSGYWKQPQNH
jgi:hypothetical protein